MRSHHIVLSFCSVLSLYIYILFKIETTIRIQKLILNGKSLLVIHEKENSMHGVNIMNC